MFSEKRLKNLIKTEMFLVAQSEKIKETNKESWPIKGQILNLNMEILIECLTIKENRYTRKINVISPKETAVLNRVYSLLLNQMMVIAIFFYNNELIIGLDRELEIGFNRYFKYIPLEYKCLAESMVKLIKSTQRFL